MPLDYGNPDEFEENNLQGMTKNIFDSMDSLLSMPFNDGILKAKEQNDNDAAERLDYALKQARKGWKELAYCIAKGVIDHITSNMEIKGIETVKSVQINGLTELPQQNIHRHPIVAESVDGKLEYTTKDYSAIDGHVK